jgi:hypothetical protein
MSAEDQFGAHCVFHLETAGDATGPAQMAQMAYELVQSVSMSANHSPDLHLPKAIESRWGHHRQPKPQVEQGSTEVPWVRFSSQRNCEKLLPHQRPNHGGVREVRESVLDPTSRCTNEAARAWCDD